MRLPDRSDLHPTKRLNSMSKDQRPYSQAAPAVHAERRAAPRTAIHRPAYISFEPYSHGGIVRDISETGLRFHTVDPLEQGGIVRASIFLAPANQIEVVGELVWKDGTRRVGGLRFVVLPPGAADQIRTWAEAPDGASNGTEKPGSDISPQVGAADAANQLQSSVSQASSAPGAPSPLQNPVMENKANIPVVPHSPQPIPPESGPAPSSRSPWVPPSMRPASAAHATPTHSQNLPGEATLTPPRQPWNPSAVYQQPGTSMPWITHFDPDPPAGRPFVRGVLGGIIVCLMLGAAGWYAAQHYGPASGPFTFNNPFTFHRNVPAPITSQPASPSADSPAVDAAPTDAAKDASRLNSLPQVQQPLAPPPEAQPSETPSSQNIPNAQSNAIAQPAPATPLAPNAAPGTYAPENKIAAAAQSPGTPQNRAAAQAPVAQLPPSSSVGGEKPSASVAPLALDKATAPQAPRPADTGESQLLLARQYLDGRGRPRNPAAASQLLWSAVEKGNSAAEMDLADLYLRGDGVTQNCDQARVLLSAASGKGNAEAMQKLRDLNQFGCH